MEGRIAGGDECPVLHTPQGDSYALALTEEDYGPGDYVEVAGELPAESPCPQPAPAIEPGYIEAIAPPERDRNMGGAGD